jgi:BMFP domain-containing protein YqiC
MNASQIFEDLQNKVSDLLENSPAADLHKNIKALLRQQFAQLDLVTRDEFDAQVAVLQETRRRLEALEARLADKSAQ